MSTITPKTAVNISVSLATAAALIDAALSFIGEAGFEATVAVVDRAGTLLAFKRMDGARFATADIAINKAWTAAAFGYPTHVCNALVADPKFAPLSNLPKVLAVGGGYPLLTGGTLVGGMAVSGGSSQQDCDAVAFALSIQGFDIP